MISKWPIDFIDQGNVNAQLAKMWNQRNTCILTFQCSFVAAKLSICVLYDPAIPLLNRDPKDMYTYMPSKTYRHIHTHTHMHNK